MWPVGPAANVIAALEALTGLMSFAIATGLLFGRFSRPSARIGFSPAMVIAPYMGMTALEFRVVNRRSNNLINLNARVLLMTVEVCNGMLQRRYTALDLERSSVLFLPLTWTVVHPIDEKSPLFEKTADDMRQLQLELIVLLEAFDESFGQTVHSRYSYRYDEIVWGAKFVQTFETEESGDMLLEIDRVGDFQRVLAEGEDQ
jgi:inward rectifier potassium channel